MLTSILTLLSVTYPLGLIIALWVLAQISRRFGEVTHRAPIYRWFYVSIVLAVPPFIVRLLALSLDDDGIDRLGGDAVEALLHDGPLTVCILLSVVICWRYWGWLVYAHDGQTPTPPAPQESSERLT
jgi:hypothetical protein